MVRHPLALLGTLLTVLVLLTALLAPVLAPYNPNAVNLNAKLTPPNRMYWFGTDEAGRDLLSRIIYGCRLSVSTGLLVMIVTTVIGAMLGAISGYHGGVLDELIMRTADFFMAFPYLILAMAIAFTLGASMQNAILAIIVVFWPSYARLIRGQVTSLRHREFVQAARVLGVPTSRILMRHILPQTWSSMVIKFSLDLGFAIIALASLGFIGLGAPPPTAEWGTMIAESRHYALTAWWYGLGPGAAIFLAVLGFNLVGDAVQELIEPSLRS
jgi:peptide/nickel transport system permease protein